MKQREVEKQTSASGRSIYTKRLLEAIAAVRKQKVEIERIAGDNMVIQVGIFPLVEIHKLHVFITYL